MLCLGLFYDEYAHVVDEKTNWEYVAVIGTTLNQRFTLEKELGRGGMGAVYRAVDQVLQRSVAIKVLKDHSADEFGKQIRIEAQILARLLHENVVRIYDFGEADGTYFLVMEEVDGTSFARRWRRLPLVERLRIVAQVAEALEYAHHQGVIHRDVKPGNVLLTSSDQAKLSDFGLSKLMEQKDESGTVRGTPHYMSPEQAQGKALDHRTDLYALGVMLYEFATGAPPFNGPVMAVLTQQVNAKPVPPREANKAISENLEQLILGLLAKNREARPPSGSAVAKALRDEIASELGRQGNGAAQPAATGTPAKAGAPLTLQAVNTLADKPPVPSGPTLQAPHVPSRLQRVPAGTSPLAKALLEGILAEPVVLTPEERYLTGHYLAYLLGGSKRSGLFLSRPLDPRNADRARLVLAMTSAMLSDGSDDAIGCAVDLIERKPEVRASLNPIVVAKYLASRSSSAKRKRFRQVRKQILDASEHAQKHMTDRSGVLNPGMMPQTLDDLKKIAPERTELDDQLVARWNRVTEVWRGAPDFREAVLKYATKDAYRDPASAELWPEVVYPLIERARWQRTFRSRHEALWDYLSAKILHVPAAGVRLDRAIVRSVPSKVIEELDVAAVDFIKDPEIEDQAAASTQGPDIQRFPATLADNGVSLHELAADRAEGPKSLVPLVSPDPQRFTQGVLRELWQEAIAALRTGGAKAGHRHVPVGPYRLTVVGSVRGRSAGTVVIQGMRDKQIEMLTPSLRLGGSASRPVVAAWAYQDNSLVVSYLDFQQTERFILWHAPNAQQTNFTGADELNSALLNLNMEAPDQVDRVLSKKFRPRNPV